MASEDRVNITFEALRDRVFGARSAAGRSVRYDSDSARVDFKFVESMALIQIAQELNEIKHALNRLAPPLEELQ